MKNQLFLTNILLCFGNDTQYGHSWYTEHLVQRREAYRRAERAAARPVLSYCTKCNSPPINGQYQLHHLHHHHHHHHHYHQLTDCGCVKSKLKDCKDTAQKDEKDATYCHVIRCHRWHYNYIVPLQSKELNCCYLPPTTEEVYMLSPARPRSFVCLSVCVQDYSKTRAWIWMKCCVCVSTDVGTWTNWLTFELDPDHSPVAGTGLLSPIAYALQRGILLRWENPTYWYWAPVEAATRGFEASKHCCRR